MPRIPLYYTVLDEQGNIVRSQITQDPNYDVGVQQRLVKDQVPDYDSITQYTVRITPVPAGQDHVEYEIHDIIITDEQLAEQARNLRHELLSKSDWTQLTDVPLDQSEKNAWTTYRQQLRDVSMQPGFPRTINWPTKPE
jgi:hypothetical protein